MWSQLFLLLWPSYHFSVIVAVKKVNWMRTQKQAMKMAEMLTRRFQVMTTKMKRRDLVEKTKAEKLEAKFAEGKKLVSAGEKMPKIMMRRMTKLKREEEKNEAKEVEMLEVKLEVKEEVKKEVKMVVKKEMKKPKMRRRGHMKVGEYQWE